MGQSQAISDQGHLVIRGFQPLGGPRPGVPPGALPVPEPDAPESLEGRFQLRCRDLIAQIQDLGSCRAASIADKGAAEATREPCQLAAERND